MVHVADAAAFYVGIMNQGGNYYTTPDVMAEVEHLPSAKLVAETLKSLGRLEIEEPTALQVKSVTTQASRTGDLAKLSPTDISILALAADLHVRLGQVDLISDDYSVLNVARSLSLEVRSVSNRGIARKIRWVLYCPGCGKSYRGKVMECNVCGTALKRKPRKIV
jgi:rRNA maturation endonuclease Nob1